MIVSFGRPGRVGASSFAGMRLARKSQGFGKICVESFPKYIKLFALEMGSINSSGANDPVSMINL
jgi:hypothetical protein